jgi:hypothetical protein
VSWSQFSAEATWYHLQQQEEKRYFDGKIQSVMLCFPDNKIGINVQ